MEYGFEQPRQGATARRRFRQGRLLPVRPAIDAVRHQGTIVLDRSLVANQLSLLADERSGTAIAKREQPAEVVHHFVGVESHRLCVVTNEGTREDAFRPSREVVAFQPYPELDADVGQRRDGLQRNPPALAFAAQPGTEGIPFGHMRILLHRNYRADELKRISAETSPSAARRPNVPVIGITMIEHS